MKHLKTYTLLLALVAMAYRSKSQEANKTSFSLQESIDYALKHSPNYLNTELDLENAEYRRKEIRGLGLPQINGSIDIKDYINIPTSLLPGQIFGGPEGSFIPVKFGTKYNATAGVSASQLIFNSDYIFALKGSKEFMNLSRISVTRGKAELVEQVSIAYYGMLTAKDRINTLEANITALSKRFNDLKAQNQQGLAELIEVERSEVQYNNLLSDRDNARNALVISENTLKFQMGYNIADPIMLSDNLNIDESSFQPLTVQFDLTQRPDYMQLKTQQTLLDLDVKRLKWGYLPTISAYGSYQFNAQRNEFNFSNDKNDPSKQWFKVALIGATLNLNIFDGLQRNYKIQQAKVASTKNLNTLRSVELLTGMQVNTAVVSYNNASVALLNQKRNRELAQHVVDVAQKKFENGVGSNLEVVTAEASLRESQTNYYSAVFNMLVAKVTYEKAIGKNAK